MWILCALVAAVGGAGTSFALKQAVARGGSLVSTVAARLLAGTLLLALVMALGGWPDAPPAYWRALSMVIVPEVMGTVFLTLALREGELSQVQPLTGLLPILVMLGGIAFLGEVPTVAAALGVTLVACGVYCVGLRPGGSALEPLRALARSRASWYAVTSACAWSITTLIHKRGIAAVGPFPWAVTLAFGSALGIAAALPFLARRGGVGIPERTGPWTGFVLLAGCSFALQQVGLHVALRATQAGYVMAVAATSIVIGTGLGIVVLGERSSACNRAAGACLISAGAATIALFG